MLKLLSKRTVMFLAVWIYAFHAHQVFAVEDDNLALKKQAFQSSTWNNNSAELAIDGDIIQWLTVGTCSHTKDQLAPWWTVDLGGNYYVQSLRIYNRNDSSCEDKNCPERLYGFRVHVSDDNDTRFQHLCHTDNKTEVPAIIDVSCASSLFGRYVTISLNLTSKGFLTLCEVKVYGSSVLSTCLKEVASTSADVYEEQSATDIASTFVLDTEIPVFSSPPIMSSQYSSAVSEEFRVFESLSIDTEVPVFSSPPIMSSQYSSAVSQEFQTSIFRTPSASVQKTCCCSLNRQTPVIGNSSEIFMSSVLKDLDMDRKNVSKQRRKYISMPDERKSSKAIGVSIMVLMLPLCWIILCDLKKIFEDVTKGLGRSNADAHIC